MRRLEIKQVSAVVGFRLKGKAVTFEVLELEFLRQYYYLGSRISDEAVLKRIQSSGLAKDVRKAILDRARLAIKRLPGYRTVIDSGGRLGIRGKLYLNLLDDEVLPILDEIPTVEPIGAL